MLSDSPPERDLQWTDTGIAASFKFINKLYELVEKFKNHKIERGEGLTTINKLKIIINEVSENIESFQFNKSVAKIYEFVNIVNDALLKNRLSQENFKWSLEKLAVILQPFVPHISEELWSNIGNKTLCINENWILENVEKYSELKIAVQINGKTKEIIEIDDKFSKEKILEIVKNNNKIKKNILGKSIIREIYVPGKIVNLVIK
jgi:leucyl-tRNA synthetase